MQKIPLEHGVFRFYKDLTVGDVAEFTPPVIVPEYETIVKQSAINEMKGTGEYKRPVKDKRISVKTLNQRQLYIRKGKDALNNFK